MLLPAGAQRLPLPSLSFTTLKLFTLRFSAFSPGLPTAGGQEFSQERGQFYLGLWGWKDRVCGNRERNRGVANAWRSPRSPPVSLPFPPSPQGAARPRRSLPAAPPGGPAAPRQPPPPSPRRAAPLFSFPRSLLPSARGSRPPPALFQPSPGPCPRSLPHRLRERAIMAAAAAAAGVAAAAGLRLR